AGSVNLAKIARDDRLESDAYDWLSTSCDSCKVHATSELAAKCAGLQNAASESGDAKYDTSWDRGERLKSAAHKEVQCCDGGSLGLRMGMRCCGRELRGQYIDRVANIERPRVESSKPNQVLWIHPLFAIQICTVFLASATI